MPASLAFCTAATVASAPALSRMIALAPRPIAVSISSRLLVGVVVMHEHQRLVAEFLGLGLGADGFRLEERIVVRRA